MILHHILYVTALSVSMAFSYSNKVSQFCHWIYFPYRRESGCAEKWPGMSDYA